ncbi:exonuclease domain-containing protein [Leeuwenhoekiella sp. A16]|uniref:exonuclease domain-containing protein n=1 Tax=unclassified Leeuwenhoekiella TaxID=2615029 RepID=UPI003A801F8E
MYAILDLETTGGKYNEEGVTEVAIYKYDGHEVVDQFISLINPERPIQAFVVGLTGINNEMLRNAPKFYEVAKRIIEITSDCIIVAHNAQFDYRILQLEFDRLGYDYQRKSLCTVELSKELLPGQQSYSLGKLVRSLGIPIVDRHRANGDALATVKLFQLLLDKDSSKTIIQEGIKLNPKKQLDTKLRDIIEEIPSITGVYYMHNANGKIIYIGKSKNIKKRIIQHFTSENRKSKKIQEEVEAVTYEATGSELIALLKENDEVKKNKPHHNTALRRTIFKNQLSAFTDEEGYINLKVERADSRKKNITTFSNAQSAKAHLTRVIKDYDLCQSKAGLHNTSGNCFNHSIKECNGACTGEEEAEAYNLRVMEYIARHSFANKNMLIIDRGRKVDERSVILVEEGIFKGFGFYKLHYQLNNMDILQRILTPMNDNRDARHIIQSYLRTKKVLKIVELDEIAK